LIEPPLPHDKIFLVAKGFKKFGGRSQIDPRDDSRVPPSFRLWFSKGWGLLRFGFSLANLSLGLVRHHRAALHEAFYVVPSTRISALTRERE
jgi:hypothetical protein